MPGADVISAGFRRDCESIHEVADGPLAVTRRKRQTCHRVGSTTRKFEKTSGFDILTGFRCPVGSAAEQDHRQQENPRHCSEGMRVGLGELWVHVVAHHSSLLVKVQTYLISD